MPSGHNRRRRLATRRCDTKRAGTTAVVPATIEWQQCLLHLHFFDTLKRLPHFPCGRRFFPTVFFSTFPVQIFIAVEHFRQLQSAGRGGHAQLQPVAGAEGLLEAVLRQTAHTDADHGSGDDAHHIV